MLGHQIARLHPLRIPRRRDRTTPTRTLCARAATPRPARRAGPPLEYVLHKRGALSEPEARPLARQLLQALAHLHARRIIHCDVKPANLVLAAPVTYTEALPRGTALKLIDFGLARRLPPANEPVHFLVDVGTRAYAAPELRSSSRLRLASNAPVAASCAAGIDCYSAGASVRHVLTGAVPSFWGHRRTERRLLSSLLHSVGRSRSPRRAPPTPYANLSAPARDLENVKKKRRKSATR